MVTQTQPRNQIRSNRGQVIIEILLITTLFLIGFMTCMKELRSHYSARQKNYRFEDRRASSSFLDLN